MERAQIEHGPPIAPVFSEVKGLTHFLTGRTPRDAVSGSAFLLLLLTHVAGIPPLVPAFLFLRLGHQTLEVATQRRRLSGGACGGVSSGPGGSSSGDSGSGVSSGAGAGTSAG